MRETSAQGGDADGDEDGSAHRSNLPSEYTPRCARFDLKTLFLVRHAKSSWDDPDLPDADRPLSGRGRRAARKMGRRLARRHRANPRPSPQLSTPDDPGQPADLCLQR